jgi:hypothetical protein
MVIVVDAKAQPPEAWGITLHDVASNIAEHAVEKGLIKPSQRQEMLDRMARFFAKEHKKPSDTARPYKTRLDA